MFPKFVLSLGNRSVYVEGGAGINQILQRRGYRMGKMDGSPWTKRFKGKAEYRRELAWIRENGFNVWGAERRKDGHVYAIDLRGGDV